MDTLTLEGTMAPEITTIDFDALAALAQRIEDRDERTGATVTRVSDWKAVIQLSRRARYSCENCGQSLTGRPGPVDWIDERTGAVQGGWSHQHGCGTWNTPVEETIHVDLYNLDENDEDRAIDELLEEKIQAALDRLDTAVAKVIADAVDAVRHRLTTQLANTARALANDPEDETWITGSETTPGVWRNGGQLEAWDYHPAGDGDIIVVTQEDA